MRRVLSRSVATIAFTIAALLCMQGSAHAQVLSGTVPLDGSQAVPPNGSAGTGTAAITLDLNTNTLSWNINFSGLSAAETAAHFHGPAPAGSTAGVQINVGTGNPKIGSQAVSASQAADIAAGLWYINIHSSMFPAGEIRGQLQVSAGPTVPTMGEWGLGAMSVILLAMGALVLRRRQALAVDL